MSKKGVVLFSGGLDSTTLLYYALSKGYKIHCLIFEYGQRHNKEKDIASLIARQLGCTYDIVCIALPWKGSSLLDKTKKLPQRMKVKINDIPSTYVPARNIIFLSFAVSCAESIKAQSVFIGANAIDYSGYPDCRPAFYQAFQQTIKRGMKSGVKGKPIKVETPLINKSKAQIIKMGMKLSVPYEKTWSCYKGIKKPCGVCDSCILRKKGFEEAGWPDPLLRQYE